MTLVRALGGMTLWFAMSAAFAGMEATQLYLQGFKEDAPRTFMWRVVSMLPAWLIFVALLWCVRALVRRYPIDMPRPWRSIRMHAIGALSFPVIHMSALAAVKLLTDSGMQLRFAGDLISYYYVRGVVLYLMAAAIFHAIDASRRASERATRAALLEASLAQAELATLRAQLSPHFLFNVLNSLGMLVRAERRAEALDLIDQFAMLLRRFLRDRPTEFVALQEELRFAEEYLAIQSVRFGERMRVSFDIAPGTASVMVPAFVLYPLVENAVKHGLPEDSSTGTIVVRAQMRSDALLLEVEDDGPGFVQRDRRDGTHERTGVGLENLRERLAKLYPSRATVRLVPHERRGIVARVELPLDAVALAAVA